MLPFLEPAVITFSFDSRRGGKNADSATAALKDGQNHQFAVPLAGLLPITGPTKAEVLDKHKSGSDNQLARSVGRRRSQLRVSHKVDVAAWAARAANNSQPLAPGSYSATATYEVDPRYYSSLHPRMTHLAT